jgi:hypothetical protein
MNPDEFYESLLPYALSVTERTGLDPRLVLAQAALETGYGRSAPNYNFFGIKSHGRSGGQSLVTSEFEGGRMVRKPQSFRGYSDPSESFEDYASFLLENPRYKNVLAATDLDSQIAAMGESGYATDPDYALKLSQIASRFPDMPKTTPEARRAQYGFGDRDPGTTAQVLQAVAAGDMTKSEAARYVSEDLLDGVEGGSAYDILNKEEKEEKEASLLDRLGDAAQYLNLAGVGQPADPLPAPRMSNGIYPGRQGVGSKALSRFGIASLV